MLDKLRRHFEQALKDQPFAQYVTNVLVDYHEAASSSLNLLVLLGFAGNAAEHCWAIRRFIQRTALDACSSYRWVVPFNQLTGHTVPS